MEGWDATSIPMHFNTLDDPRIERNKLHRLIDIITIAVCGVISGADTWTDIEEYGKSKLTFLHQFLELPNGIPSHDTFSRVFARIDPIAFQERFLTWVQGTFAPTEPTTIAIDGKTLRGSYHRASTTPALHMVSAWASERRLVLGQVATDSKSNEITAIPVLLDSLDIGGCTVTIDAMGCQKAIAEQIVRQGGTYMLALKKNQRTLFNDVAAIFERANAEQQAAMSRYERTERGHGRIVHQCYVMTDQLDSLRTRAAWAQLTSVGMVETFANRNGKQTTERRYYINNDRPDATNMAYRTRSHWGIENHLHWQLDVSFNEDRSRVWKDHGPANLAVLRHIAVNLVRHEQTTKGSVRTKRHRAGWDDAYLLKVLTTPVTALTIVQAQT
jgi:predicted transposase YbfD/YdcC